MDRIKDPEARIRIKNDVGEYLVEQILSHLADSTSPVSGGAYKKKLSKEYAEKKLQETGSDDPNLDASGGMISALDYKPEADGIEIGIFGSEAPKADGHNNFSGKSRLPTRQFLPKMGETFRNDIISGVEDIIREAIAKEVTFDTEELKFVRTQADLYRFLLSEIGIGGTRASIRRAVMLNGQLLEALEAADLMDLL